MVTILESKSLLEPNLHEPGDGGLPPFDEIPTGGGGGGSDDWSQSWNGPFELALETRFFVISALLADLFFFGILTLFCSARVASEPLIARSSSLLPPVMFLNAALLMLSSLAMEIARRNIFREVDVLEEWLGFGRPALKRALPWLGAAIALGALFLAGQAFAWGQLSAQGIHYRHLQPDSIGYNLFQLTGAHALHMTLCLLAAVFGFFALGRFKRAELRQTFLDATAWCWHAMTITWLGLLAFLTFC
jgi:cytochrome c oxidase subunit 3